MISTNKYWWVNHKQTGKIEVNEGYIWSPKTIKGGSKNQTYLNLKETGIGDYIFSFVATRIVAIGVVIDSCKDSIRPAEFGKSGNQWAPDGWLVPINWIKLSKPIVPKDKISLIAPLLPIKYSPIKPDGNGNQGCYLAEISQILANLLISFIDELNPMTSDVITGIENTVKENIEEDKIQKEIFSPTYKLQLIEARVGQGVYRMKLEGIEQECRITKLKEKAFLIASHIKPWRDSSDDEKLDGNNGLLLSPHIDKLFDRGYISFKDKGEILVSSKCPDEVFYRWQLNSLNNVGSFNNHQKEYLSYHRDLIFK
jgi:putative restriction endonuclease